MTQKTKEDSYKKMHQWFISKDDGRPKLRNSFNAFGKTFSTNGFSMLITPQLTGYSFNSQWVENLYPHLHRGDFTIDVNLVRKMLVAAPKTFQLYYKELNCDACNGDGFVEYSFEYKEEEYTIEEECPICDGDGIIQTKTNIPAIETLDLNNVAKIGEYYFYLGRVLQLLNVASELKQKTIYFLNEQNANNGAYFKTGDVEILIMPIPLLNFNKEQVVIEIENTIL